MFSVRIVTVNYYQGQPIRDLDVAFSDFRGSEVKQVPVLRIFGATPAGQKTCLHIHGVFPYIYIGCTPQDFTTDKELLQFATSLDLALQVSMGKASGNTHHVFKAICVQAVPMYGYHSRSRRFLKVYFYNPFMVKRAVELLQSGAVMNKVFQPHEAHIPYILQFLIDYNLFGMNLIHLAAVKFRCGQEQSVDSEVRSQDTQPISIGSAQSSHSISSQKWNKDNMTSALLLDADIQRQSVCELEVDAVATDILNRHELQGNTEMNPGLLAIYNDERERREVKGQMDDLHPPSSPERGVIEDTDSELHGKARLSDIIDKQLSELRAMVGEDEEDKDEDDSELHDTMAEPLLTASQIIQHDSQYAGDESSIVTPEDSQPIIDEELVQSLVEASQHSGQFSQMADEDGEMVQLLVDLAQGKETAEDGSILSSQQTEDEKEGCVDEDVKESLEMSQVWDGDDDDDDETPTQLSQTTHDVSSSEDNTQGSQVIIPQLDGSSDDKPAHPSKKKTLGVRRKAPNLSPKLPPTLLGKLTEFAAQSGPSSHKRLIMTSPVKATQNISSDQANIDLQKAIFAKVKNSDSSIKKKIEFKSKPHVVKMISCQGKAPHSQNQKPKSSQQNKMIGNQTQAIQKSLSLTHQAKPGSLETVPEKKLSATLPSFNSLTTTPACQNQSVPAMASTSVISHSSDENRYSLEGSSHPPNTDKELEKVPSTSKEFRLKVCKELESVCKLSLDKVKQDPMWNPVVMLIKCPIETDAKGKISFSGTSLPRKQLERIRKDNLKAHPGRRSSFSRKIKPPKRFMDEQFWMSRIMKVAKYKEKESSTPSMDGCTGVKQKQVQERNDKVREEKASLMDETNKSLDLAMEPPCLESISKHTQLKPSSLLTVQSEDLSHQEMPILEKVKHTDDLFVRQYTKKSSHLTKTKAILQQKYTKTLKLSIKKNKLSRSVSKVKHHKPRDDKTYEMLSQTFDKLGLSSEQMMNESTQGSTLKGESTAENTDPKIVTSTAESSLTSSILESSPSFSRSIKQSDVQSTSMQSTPSPSNNTSPPRTIYQSKKKSTGIKKRHGSGNSDDWAKNKGSQKCQSNKRKRSMDETNHEKLLDKSYGFRKRERISYDDGDFPDVGFDILCWSDEEEVVDSAFANTAVDSMSELKQAGSVTESSHITTEAGKGFPWSPQKKRGRPPGSKNKKSKLLKSGSHSAKKEDKKSSPSRPKPQLSFTVDSMLHNGRSINSPSKTDTTERQQVQNLNQSIVSTTHGSMYGPITYRTTTASPRINEDTHSNVSLSEPHNGSCPRASDYQPAVNGHFTSYQDTNSEATLYRDAMWNLGYFSPRKTKKEGSPPRCWSPSEEGGQLFSSMREGFQQNLTQNQRRENGERSNRMGHNLSNKMETLGNRFSGSTSEDENSRQEGENGTNMQLINVDTSRNGNGSLSEQMCNTGLLRIDNVTGITSRQFNEAKHKSSFGDSEVGGVHDKTTNATLSMDETNVAKSKRYFESEDESSQSDDQSSNHTQQDDADISADAESTTSVQSLFKFSLSDKFPKRKTSQKSRDICNRSRDDGKTASTCNFASHIEKTSNSESNNLSQSVLLLNTQGALEDASSSNLSSGQNFLSMLGGDANLDSSISTASTCNIASHKEKTTNYESEDLSQVLLDDTQSDFLDAPSSNLPSAQRFLSTLAGDMDLESSVSTSIEDVLTPPLIVDTGTDTCTSLSPSPAPTQSVSQKDNPKENITRETQKLYAENVGSYSLKSDGLRESPSKRSEESAIEVISLSSNKTKYGERSSDDESFSKKMKDSHQDEDANSQSESEVSCKRFSPEESSSMLSCPHVYSPQMKYEEISSDDESQPTTALHDIMSSTHTKPDDLKDTRSERSDHSLQFKDEKLSSDDEIINSGGTDSLSYITPGQRKCIPPSDSDGPAESDDSDIYGASNGSSSTGASLSLDMSQIINCIPSISPTREVFEPSSGSLFTPGRQSRQRESVRTQVDETRHTEIESDTSQASSSILNITDVSYKKMHQESTCRNTDSDCSENSKFQKNRVSEMPSASSWSSSSESTSSFSKGKPCGKLNSKDTLSDNNESFSQLVCPETPSPHGTQYISSQSNSITDSQSDADGKTIPSTPGKSPTLHCKVKLSTNTKSKIDRDIAEGLLRINYKDKFNEESSNYDRTNTYVPNPDSYHDNSNMKASNLEDSSVSTSKELEEEPLNLVLKPRDHQVPSSEELSAREDSGEWESDEVEPMEIDTSQEGGVCPDSSESGSSNPMSVSDCTDPEKSIPHEHSVSSQEDCLSARQTSTMNQSQSLVDKLSDEPCDKDEALVYCKGSQQSGSQEQDGISTEMIEDLTTNSLQLISQSVQDPLQSTSESPPTTSTRVPSILRNTTTTKEDESLSDKPSKVWTPLHPPPSADDIQASLQEYGLPQLRHKKAFCGNPNDVHQSSKPGVHDEGHLQSNLPSSLPEAESKLSQTGLNQWQANMMALSPHPLLLPSNIAPECGLKAALVGDVDAVITPCRSPPSVKQVQEWLDDKNNETDKCKEDEEDKNDKDKDKTNQTVTKTSQPKDDKEHLAATMKEDVHSAILNTKANDSQNKPSMSQMQTPKFNLPLWINNGTQSSKVVSSPMEGPSRLSPTPWNTNSSLSQRDTPLVGRESSQPQHSTPLRVHTQSKGTPLPVTPISGWKKPRDPMSAGPSCERQSSSSSMRQSLLFTPREGSGDGRHAKDWSQIEGATPSNTCGFKFGDINMQYAKATHEIQHLSIMSLELHIKTRRDYHPDPDSDPIRALFYSIQQDTPLQHDGASQGSSEQSDGDLNMFHGVIMVDDSNHSNAGPSTSCHLSSHLAHSGLNDTKITSVASEAELLDQILCVIRKYDPDILVGYEIQQHSWGYLLERAAFLDVDLCTQISRLPEFKKESHFASERDAYGADHQSEINIAGRITLNLWRLMRHEVALTNYTFENIAFHVLHQRIPLFSYRTLTDWFDHKNPQLYRWRVMEYYTVRVRGSLKLLHQLDLIGRTSELARVFGIQFYCVLSRGSQYRVESMMMRTAKPQNYVAMSPSVQQRSRMKAPECIPLVMEPESRFYKDPVIVLDFQSLYPSMMIAYNYCYSTCLGRLEHIANGGEYAMGCGTLSNSISQFKKLLQSDGLHISPNGIVFVKSHIRRGVVPTMLEQILNLRLIVKKALKDFKDNKALNRMLNSRQLALKYIANFTYGYTSASFSGRMPCIEVGDSVVRKGRETLERAIHLVETTKKWGARVVYGDTDSMFVLVEGASKERAFEVGREIRDAVTAANPKPVKLKLEKVYHPCVLQSKKRYVGYSYESPDQSEPDFDAKGIETVRRDSCPAVGKILEKALKTLFTTHDVSQVKKYVQKQFLKILDGQATMQDLIFAKEYRGQHSYRPGACVPSLEITRRLLAVDRRAEPRVGQRVPYVVVYGSPGLPLIQLVRTPSQVLEDPSLRLNTTYYLTRQLVPSLNRVFGLLGVDTMQWYQELPRWQRVTSHHQLGTPGKKGTISQYFVSLNCVICEKVTQTSICDECKSKSQVTSTALMSRVQQWQKAQQDIAKICASCCNFSEQGTHGCISLDCPVMFKTNKLLRQLGQVPFYLQLLEDL
ncbi:DNA polymerase zeta catalytic subunit-like [Asterias amurensis]|uniref:DNA polymerase zeta catalytic subunit-like n=1 Tax=Asterias amurensis TaxID=7602 RepID=UPI003AB87F86